MRLILQKFGERVIYGFGFGLGMGMSFKLFKNSYYENKKEKRNKRKKMK